MAEVYVTLVSFVADRLYSQGETVEKGHPVIAGREALFEPASKLIAGKADHPAQKPDHPAHKQRRTRPTKGAK